MNIKALLGLIPIWFLGWGLWRLFAGSPFRWLIVGVAVIAAIIIWARTTTVTEEVDKKLDQADKAERQGRYADALPLLLDLAKLGDGRIAERIAMYYLEGKVGARDVASAIPWLDKAAAAGRSDAQRELGLLYLTGEGVRINLVRAAELLEYASNVGDPAAQYHLGKMLEEGRGIPAKAEVARDLLAKAAAAGYRGPERAQTATLIPAVAGSIAAAPKAPLPPVMPTAAAPSPVARKPELKLKFAGVRHRVSKEDGEITIGRDSVSVIHVGAPHVSRRHATIIWMDDGYPVLVNLSKSGTSIQQEGGQAMTLDGSTRLEGAGRIGLFADFAYAEANDSVVAFEAKWPTRG